MKLGQQVEKTRAILVVMFLKTYVCSRRYFFHLYFLHLYFLHTTFQGSLAAAATRKMVINGKKYTYSETWSIAAMTCSQDGRGGISRGVFCPKIPGNENRVNVLSNADMVTMIKV